MMHGPIQSAGRGTKTHRAQSPFHIIAKPIGPICNLDCKYCFYLEKEKLYPERTGKQGWAATDAVLENYIHQYIEAQPLDAVNFTWQGGEPTLLGVEFFEKVLRYEQQYAAGKRIENSFRPTASDFTNLRTDCHRD